MRNIVEGDHGVTYGTGPSNRGSGAVIRSSPGERLLMGHFSRVLGEDGSRCGWLAYIFDADDPKDRTETGIIYGYGASPRAALKEAVAIVGVRTEQGATHG